MAPLENPEQAAQRQDLIEEYLRLVGGDENGIPHVLAAGPEAVLEIQAAAHLLSMMVPDSFEEQVQEIRARFASIERTADEDAENDKGEGAPLA